MDNSWYDSMNNGESLTWFSRSATVTQFSIANIAYNFWFNWLVPDWNLVWNSWKHFSGYYFQWVVAKIFWNHDSKCIDVYSLRPDLEINYNWKKIFLEVKSGYKWNWILFRPNQLLKFSKNEYSDSYCVFVFHKCRKLETKFKLFRENIISQLEISSIFVFPIDLLLMERKINYKSSKKIQIDTIWNPYTVLKENDFRLLYDKTDWEKNIYWLSICNFSRNNYINQV